MLIVLVHGIYNTSRRFRVMRAEFERKGYRCVAPSLMPNSGRKGLEHLALQLKDAIDHAIESNQQDVCLVGFSMGGLVARYYLQELDGYRSTTQFFSIAAPHHGSLWAYCLPILGVRQMRPDSEFIRLLQQNSGRLQKVACYSYWTPFDMVILPATSSVWKQANNIRVNVWAHPLMVRDARVIDDIVEKLAIIDSGRA